MSGRYYVTADEGQRWAFSADAVMRTAMELRPDATVSAPSGQFGTVEIDVRGEIRNHSIRYHSKDPGFVFPEQDEIEVPAGVVLQLLQRLAPDVAAVWFADFEGVVHPLRLTGSIDDFVNDLLSDQ
jgi:hypothetical protein